MPDTSQIVMIDDVPHDQSADLPGIHERLCWIDELEEAIKTSFKAEVRTREELEQLVQKLAAEAAALDDD